ncbi:MAG: hypothetical protein K5886_03115 [Lachnospiraceae bacterium]|nr:hypothetical protein [Lachnospiraceae bacterium]
MGLTGCGAAKYRLSFDGFGFGSEKTSYAEGETVTFTYDMVATDTDYRFFADSGDVKLKQEFDGKHGYVFTFTMPAHDVKISMESRNTMTMDPEAHKPETDTADPGNKEDSMQTETWYCPECGTKNDTKYCAQCGFKKPQ